MKINPYLVFRGNAEEALNFYNSVLQGDLQLERYSAMPGDMPMPDEMRDKIMHGSLTVGNHILMATDSMEGMGPKFSYGDSFFVSCNPDSGDEAKRVFAGLSEGGKVLRELQVEHWGGLFGMFVDKFGVYWMLNYQATEK